MASVCIPLVIGSAKQPHSPWWNPGGMALPRRRLAASGHELRTKIGKEGG